MRIHIGDTIILPLVDVSFGVAAGAFSQDKKNNGAGGMGGKIMPSAVLVIQNGTTKLVNIKNQDGVTKILDMVPDFVNKFTSRNQVTSDTASAADEDETKARSGWQRDGGHLKGFREQRRKLKTVEKLPADAYDEETDCLGILCEADDGIW